MKFTKRNKVIIKSKCLMKLDDLDRLTESISNDLEKKGFVVLDNRYNIYVISSEEECDD